MFAYSCNGRFEPGILGIARDHKEQQDIYRRLPDRYREKEKDR